MDKRATTHHCFQVRAKTTSNKQFLCAFGDHNELGEWDVRKGLRLENVDKNKDLWQFALALPHQAQIRYRYALCRQVTCRGQAARIVERVESTPRVRQFSSPPTPHLGPSASLQVGVEGEELQSVTVDDGDFGSVGEGGCGGGGSADWCLDRFSEVQFQLCSSDLQAALADLSQGQLPSAGEGKEEEVSIRVSAVSVDEKDEILPVQARCLDLSAGDCVSESSGRGLPVSLGRQQSQRLLVFFARVPDVSYCSFLLEVLSPEREDLLCSSRVSAEQLKDDAGRLVLPLLNSQQTAVGTLNVDYIVVHPVRSGPVGLSASDTRSVRWAGREGGHKGMGSSFDFSRPDRISPTENTIESFREAARIGADFVELDVQLTSDLQLVVFHDFYVCTANAEEEGGEGGGPAVRMLRVRDLSLRELRSAALYHEHVVKSLRGEVRREDLKKFALDRPEDRGTADKRTFPLLDEVLRATPKELALNIEVKYPTPSVSGEDTFPYFPHNLYADLLLECLQRYQKETGNGREIFISSFDPGICTVLQRKQCLYPVFFLTCTERHTWEYKDPRTKTLSAARAFVQSQHIPGICLFSKLPIESPECVGAMRGRGLTVCTFGAPNNDRGAIAAQQKAGVQGVIYDLWKVQRRPPAEGKLCA